MRYAILSDIHGNLEALDTVLADIDARGVDAMVCLGDFVGYGAAPNECIAALRPRIEAAVAGNHDLAACGRIKLGYFNPDAAQAATSAASTSAARASSIPTTSSTNSRWSWLSGASARTATQVAA